MTGYCTLDELREALRLDDVDDDLMLQTAISAASARIDAHCGRTFTQDATATARTFDVVDTRLLLVDDISTTSGLLVGGSPYSPNFTPDPLNAIAKGEPITALRAVPGALRVPGRRYEVTIDVTARWGWPAVPVAIKQASIILAGRLAKRSDSLLGVMGFGDLGAVMVRNVDPDVEQLVARYRRGDTGFGIA